MTLCVFHPHGEGMVGWVLWTLSHGTCCHSVFVQPLACNVLHSYACSQITSSENVISLGLVVE